MTELFTRDMFMFMLNVYMFIGIIFAFMAVAQTSYYARTGRITWKFRFTIVWTTGVFWPYFLILAIYQE